MVLVGVAAALSAWQLDQGLPGADEGSLLSAADRIAQGQVYYRDLDAYPLPGASYLLALAFRVLGPQLAVSRGLAGLLFCVLVACLYAVATRLLSPARAALYGLCLLALKLVAWPGFTVYSYYDVAFVGACGALAWLLRHRFVGPTASLFAAGVCAGVALVSKQNVGLYLGAVVCALIVWARPLRLAPAGASVRRVASLAVFGGGAALVALPFVAWFTAHGLFVAMVESALLHPLSGYLTTSGVSYLVPLRWWQLGSLEHVAAFPYFPVSYWVMLQRRLLPEGADYAAHWLAGELFVRLLYSALPIGLFVAVWASARAALRKRGDPARALVVPTAVGLAVVASAFPRADFAHVIAVYPLALLLLFASWERFVGVRHARSLRIEAALVTVGLVACGWLAATRSAQRTERLDLARAHVRVDPHDAYVGSVLRYLGDELGEGDRLFVHGSDASWYFLTGRYYPWPFLQLYPGQAGGDGGRALVELLRREPPAFVVQSLQRLPGLPPLASYAPVLDAYVREHFRVDPEPFRRYPPPAGAVPSRRTFALLRPAGG